MNRWIGVSILLVLVMAVRLTAQQPARSVDDARRITGRIFNHDGRPSADQRVTLQKIGEFRFSRDANTNEAGEFRFDGLSSGVYMMFTLGLLDDEQQKFYYPGDFVTLRMKRGGVITGTVIDSNGQPVIAARLRVLRVRDEQGRRINYAGRFSPWSREPLTDDRGIYRFWGLPPGSYLVSVGGKNTNYANDLSTLSDDVPTYHPSSATPAAATEVSVNEGQEATGIDIHYRGAPGHAIKGYIFGPVASGSPKEGVGVLLTQAATGALVGRKGIDLTGGSNSFVFEGLADEAYDLTALHIIEAGQPHVDAASPPRRVTVKGQDVTGIEVKLAPLGSMDGRLVLEADRPPRCPGGRPARLDETVMMVNREGTDPLLPSFISLLSNAKGMIAVPDQRGDFQIRSLHAARYHLGAQLPSTNWYLSSINRSGPAPSTSSEAAGDGIVVKPGERISGLTMIIREGAASLQGRVVVSKASTTGAAGLNLHLIPAARPQRDQALRFAATTIQRDGSFLLTNLAPGHYWLLARPVDDLRDEATRARRGS